jgi:hypothetical protein
LTTGGIREGGDGTTGVIDSTRANSPTRQFTNPQIDLGFLPWQWMLAAQKAG